MTGLVPSEEHIEEHREDECLHTEGEATDEHKVQWLEADVVFLGARQAKRY